MATDVQQHPGQRPPPHLPIPIIIDEHPYPAPKEEMTGVELRLLARPPIGPDRDLFEVKPGPADDLKVGDDDVVHLKPGTHFYSAPKTINPGDRPRLHEADELYLAYKGLKWSMPAKGFLVLEQVPVSSERYDHAAVDLMIQIPAGYPIAALDMFYVHPHLRLRSGGYPNAAAVFEMHCGRNWQRFSRHLSAQPWRPGVDSLKSFLALVLGELQGRR